MARRQLSGEEIEELKQQGSVHFWPHARPAGDLSPETGIKMVTKGHGVWVEDVEGTEWFDVIAGMYLKAIGHGRKEIAEAVYRQMTEGLSYSPGGTVTPVTVQLVSKVASLAPDKDSRLYLTSGGAEAVETAYKMAKRYHVNNGEPTRWKIINRWGSYHGATYATGSLGGGTGYGISVDAGPPLPGSVHVANPDQYRCLYCADKGGCNLECAKDVERAILHEGPQSVAAFLGEPVSAASGVHIPHPEYWPTIRQICDKYGVILIADEVINGFGRMGKMFASEHWDLKPDIMTVAKQLTSGYIPVGAAIASKKVADAFVGSEEKAFRHLITFGGNPVACAAGLANLAIIEGEHLVENSARMGEYLYEQLQTLYEHPIVGQVRGGMGLLAAIEFVKDRATKEKFPKDAELGKKLSQGMFKRRLLGRAGDVMSISPALTITRDEVDWLVKQIDEVIGEAEKGLGVK